MFKRVWVTGLLALCAMGQAGAQVDVDAYLKERPVRAAEAVA